MGIRTGRKNKAFPIILCLLLGFALLFTYLPPDASANTKISDARYSVLRVLCDNSTGTAFIIAQSSTTTYLVTNMHVIEDDPYNVYIVPDTLQGELIPAQVIYYQDGLDLVILSTGPGLGERPVLPLVGTSDVNFADTVYAIGFPGAADEVIDDWNLLPSSADDVTVTMGTVGNPSKKIDNGISAIQSDVRISFGNSGGPLLNEDAEVVGINTWIYSEGAYGLSYSIHIDYLIDICKEIGVPYITKAGEMPAVEENTAPDTVPADSLPIPGDSNEQSATDGDTDEIILPEDTNQPDSPLGFGFIYDNLGLVVSLGSILILAALTLVLVLTSTSGEDEGHGFTAWLKRNKLACLILAGGIATALVIGIVLPAVFSPRPSQDDLSIAATPEMAEAPEETPLPETPVPQTTPTPPPPTPVPLPTPDPATPPALPPTPPAFDEYPPSDHAVVGSWVLDEGAWLYHFGESDCIVFCSNGLVISSEGEAVAQWNIDDDDYIKIVDNTGFENFYSVTVEDGAMTIVDSAGDSSVYANVTDSFIDDWEYQDGDWIWVFGRSEYVSFFDDNTVSLSETDSTAVWELNEEAADVLIIFDSEYEILREFYFLVYGENLLIIDEDGDIAVLRRA